MSWQRPQKTVKHVMAPYTEGGRYMNQNRVLTQALKPVLLCKFQKSARHPDLVESAFILWRR